MSTTMETLNNKIAAIADAIREKTGSTDLMTMDEMVIAIQNISGKPSPTSYTAVLCDLFGVDYTEYPYIIIEVDMNTDYTTIYFTKSVSWSDTKLELDYYFVSYKVSGEFKTTTNTMHTMNEVCDYMAANIDSFETNNVRPSFTFAGNVYRYGYKEHYANFNNESTQSSNYEYYLKFE